jgi:exopolysaccharide biosynthesis WecB/TagA/CpsF family protein
MDSIEILGVPVAVTDRHGALAEIERLGRESAPSLIAYANAHTLNLASRSPEYKRVLEAAGVVLNDGAGIAIAARIQGTRFPENLNGSDFNPLIVELAARLGWPVFFLGARDGVAEQAARILKDRYPELQVAGTHHGYFEDEGAMVARVRESGAAVVMVAMGNPLQEMFLDRNLPAMGARLGVGVGAFFDFTTGTVQRAPTWMNKAGIEWVYRLLQEPGRMWRRYVLGNPEFLWRVLRSRLKRAR